MEGNVEYTVCLCNTRQRTLSEHISQVGDLESPLFWEKGDFACKMDFLFRGMTAKWPLYVLINGGLSYLFWECKHSSWTVVQSAIVCSLCQTCWLLCLFIHVTLTGCLSAIYDLYATWVEDICNSSQYYGEWGVSLEGSRSTENEAHVAKTHLLISLSMSYQKRDLQAGTRESFFGTTLTVS